MQLPGLAYAPLAIIKASGWLTQEYPTTHVTWDTVTTGDAALTAVTSGSAQMAATGDAPFLLGYSKGVHWKILSALSDEDQWLEVKSSIKSLAEITPADKIGVAGLSSTGAVLLKQAALSLGRSASAFDTNMVVIGQVPALQELKTGQLSGVVSVVPYEYQEAAFAHKIYSTYQAFGQVGFSGLWVSDSFYGAYPAFSKAFLGLVVRAITLLAEHPNEAATLADRGAGNPVSVAQYHTWLTGSATTFTAQPDRLIYYAQAMQKFGILKSVPTLSELETPALASMKGS